MNTVNTTAEALEAQAMNVVEKSRNSATFILFAEYLGYQSKFISWADDACHGVAISQYKQAILVVEAKRIYNQILADGIYFKEDLSELWDKASEVTLDNYNTNAEKVWQK